MSSSNISDGQTLIEAKGLRHSYGDEDTLSIDSWSLIKGEHQLLLGPSGSGKTTFLSIITGLLKATAGNIFVQAADLPKTEIKHIAAYSSKVFGIVFQDHHLISSLSLDDNLRLAQKVSQKPIDPNWSTELLKRLGLFDKRKAKPHMLSRGEIQRAALARAASTRPHILIADEPTSALDDENTKEVMAILTDLADHSGATLLVASHDSRIMPYFSKQLSLKGYGEKVAV